MGPSHLSSLPPVDFSSSRARSTSALFPMVSPAPAVGLTQQVFSKHLANECMETGAGPLEHTQPRRRSPARGWMALSRENMWKGGAGSLGRAGSGDPERNLAAARAENTSPLFPHMLSLAASSSWKELEGALRSSFSILKVSYDLDPGAHAPSLGNFRVRGKGSGAQKGPWGLGIQMEPELSTPTT